MQVRYTGDTDKDLVSMIHQCAHIASRWYDHETDRAEVAEDIMTAMAFASQLCPSFGTPGPGDFLRMLEQPLSSWLPGAPDVILVSAGRSTEDCALLLRGREERGGT